MTTVIASLTLGACGDDAPTGESASTMPSIPAGAQTAAEHVGHGTLNSINREAGVANITHEAVASAGWPAMTMSFKLADPAAVPELTAGQRIEFSFTTEGGGTITRITAE
jgi:Cu(I)/Ag(I) efflux system membrane fusion protein